METNYYEEDDEINLVDLIAYVFRHLKKILIVSVVVALLIGGVVGFKKSRANTETNSDDVKDYLASKELLDDKINLVVEDLNKYANEIELDTGNYYQAKAVYLVDTNYQVIPNSNYQNLDYTGTVIDAYINLLTSNEVIKDIAKKHNVSVDEINDYIYIFSRNYTINIDVFYKDEKTATSILHDLEDALLSFKDEVSSKIVENSLSMISETSYQGLDDELIQVQQEKLTIVNNYITNLTDLKTKLDSLVNPVSEDSSNQYVKYGIIGFVGSFFVLCLYYAFEFIFRGKVYSCSEFKDKMGIKVLGNLTYSKITNKYISWINKLEKRPTDNDFDLIVSNIKAYGKSNKVLLSGDVDDSIKQDIVSNLKKSLTNIEIITGGSLLTDSASVNALNDVDSVILVVKCNDSSYKNIKEEKSKLDDLKINNVYAIVVE